MQQVQVNFRMTDLEWEAEPTEEDLIEAQRDLEMAQKIYEHIQRHVVSGAYWFRVRAMVRGGIAVIEHMLLPPQHGYVIHLSDLANEYGWRKVVQAANFILEIFNLPRHKYNADIFRERSKEQRASKLGFVKRQVDLTTGKSKIILPDWYGAKA